MAGDLREKERTEEKDKSDEPSDDAMKRKPKRKYWKQDRCESGETNLGVGALINHVKGIILQQVGSCRQRNGCCLAREDFARRRAALQR
ncbi:hypothetical protein RUM43_001585 [Polyplax serrata]|uniref:Uncharacterized protein n=1 Tax=Polyplax serrata TaxID=468196 RepID=A0AAN8XQH2_POLSC